MKKLFHTVFFVDNEASGAFLALTIWLLAPWFAANLLATSAFTHAFLLQRHAAYCLFPMLFAVTGAAVVYPAILLIRCIALSLHEILKPRPLGVLSSGVAMIAIAFIFFRESLIRLHSKYLAYFAAGPATATPDTHLDWLFQRLDWLYVCLTVLLLIGGYLLLGKSIAVMTKTDLRKLFGKCVYALWLSAFIVYAGTGIASLCSIARYHGTLRNARAFFGRELNGPSLGELFYHGETPDAGFWKTLAEENTAHALPPLFDGAPSLDGYAFTEGLPQEAYAAWKAKVLAPETTAWLEERFSKPLPPPQKDFSESAFLPGMGLPELAICRPLARREAWMTRFALENHDFKALQASLKRSAIIGDFLASEPFHVSKLMEIACGAIRAQSLTAVISSDLVDESWLEQLILEMKAREKKIAEQQQDVAYCECVTLRNGWEHFFFRSSSMPNEKPVVRPAVFFWILPKFSDFAYSNVNAFLRKMTVRDFTSSSVFKPRPCEDKYMMSNFFIPAYSVMATKVRQYQGVCREIVMLAQAELVKRRTGNYPIDLANTPMAPLLEDSHMHYLYGDFEAKIPVWSPEDNCIVLQTQTVHGIKVSHTPPDEHFWKKDAPVQMGNVSSGLFMRVP